MRFSLLPLSTTALQWLASARVPEDIAARAEPGAMPPAFVAERALAMEAEAAAPALPTSFLIVDDHHASIVGACGFKTPLGPGCVEVGYGVAEGARGQGAATAALVLLSEMAAAAGAAEVLAEINPANLASLQVARKAGFHQVGTRVDEDHELLTQWVRTAA